jgi:GAF domain-containing protein
MDRGRQGGEYPADGIRQTVTPEPDAIDTAAQYHKDIAEPALLAYLWALPTECVAFLMDHQADIDAIERITAVPTILDVVCRVTGMRFAAVARVTEDRWICCAAKDNIDFGLKPGGELKIETTICNEIRESREAIIIDHVAEDKVFCGHHTPAMYGFQSYISMPIFLKDGRFFGTLCAIDPQPAKLNNPEVTGMFKLFAELIGTHLDALDRVTVSEAMLLDERKSSELREQFIAVLGHDLRNPLAALSSAVRLFLKAKTPEQAAEIGGMMQNSVQRMHG